IALACSWLLASAPESADKVACCRGGDDASRRDSKDTNLCDAQFAFQARRFIFSDFGMKRLFVCAFLLLGGADLFAQQNTPRLQEQETPPIAPHQNTPPLPPPEEGALPMQPSATPPPIAPIVVAAP